MMVLCYFKLLVFVFMVKSVLGDTKNGPTHGKKVVCYIHAWAGYRLGVGQFNIEDTDPSLCTDVIYAYASLEEAKNSIKSADEWQDLHNLDHSKDGYRRVVDLKKDYPHLKVTISIGGWSDGSTKYSAMVATAATRQTFVQSVLEFLKLHKFDGLDLHWKFPTMRGGSPNDKENYALLLKELKEAFTPHKYLLTAALGATKSTLEAAYDFVKLNEYLDFMHLLAYDYHGPWDGLVRPHAPLRGDYKNDTFNIEFSVKYMINNGVSPGKIILGLPFFGRTFELVDPNVKSVKLGVTPTLTTMGIQGPYTAEPGLMGYNEICMETSNKSAHWSQHWDDNSATAYIRDKGRVVCYDNGRAIAVKVKMVVDRGFGGLMVESLDMDDFRGLCDAEVDTYVDFTSRLSELAANPQLSRVIRSLNLPTTDRAAAADYYVTSNGQLSLRLPQRTADSNYNLLRTVNEAASLATQEKRIADALGINNLQEYGPTHGKKVVCYIHAWAGYRLGVGQFNIEDVDPSLCTNVIYAYANLNEADNAIKSADEWQDLHNQDHSKDGYRRVVDLKKDYPHLKVTISIGGWSDGSTKYSAMVATAATRQAFVQSVLEFLKLHKFDGLDLHWKFPTMRGGSPNDKENFALLLKELKEAFAPHNYLLTAALGATKSILEVYDLVKLNEYLDFMHLLAYDYHGPWDGLVRSHAPVRGDYLNDAFNIEFSVNYMIDNGVSPGKIILGLPFFGRTFELVDPTVESIKFGETTTLTTMKIQGPYTVEPGLMGYNEICMETSNKSAHWSQHWDDNSATAYIRDKGRVVCYDNGRSIAVKVKMVVDRGFGGLMVESLDMDDFRGLCDAEVDTYVDFTSRLSELAANPQLSRVIRSLNLPTTNTASATDYYVTSNGQLSLRLPQRTADSNYNLLRTVNEAASLATQEKRIADALPARPLSGADDVKNKPSVIIVASSQKPPLKPVVKPRQCQLNPHPSVEYTCLVFGVIKGERACNSYEPVGTIVRPSCRKPNYYYSFEFTNMQCVDYGSYVEWNYVARCKAECGTATPKATPLVYGGKTVKKGELPWHAGIYTKTTKPYKQVCGGSLISNNMIISAAHCFWAGIEKNQASDYAVAVGKIYLPWSDTHDEAQQSDVQNIHIPSRYQGSLGNFQDDIALVVVVEAFVYQPFVRPVCLNFDAEFEKQQLQSSNYGTVAGWGLTSEDGKAAPILQAIQLPYVDVNTCLLNSPFNFRSFITSDKICAGTTQPNSALCKGDSGGGLAFPNVEFVVRRYYLRGIVSTAPTNEHLCNTAVYTSFTKISKHEAFIKQYWTDPY